MKVIYFIFFSILVGCQGQTQNKTNLQSRLIGDPPANLDSIPNNNIAFFTAQSGNRIACSGAAIHYRWIVTTASCALLAQQRELRYLALKEITIEAGATVFQKQAKPINRAFSHPSYVAQTRANDVGLVEIWDNMPIDTIYFIPKVNQNNWFQTEVIVRGFSEAAAKITLAQSSLDIVDFNWCRKYINNLPPTKLCTARAIACRGDQGAPLIISSTNELLGIVSIPDQNAALCSTGTEPVTSYMNLVLYRVWLRLTSGIPQL